MKRNRFIPITAIVIIGILICWLSIREINLRPATTAHVSDTASPLAAPRAQPLMTAIPQEIAGQRLEVIKKIEGAFSTPISFYGRVIDQGGDPVPDATIVYNALDEFAGPGTEREGKSDDKGNFSLSDSHGAVLQVGVRKQGYYMIDGKSADAFAYGISPDPATKAPPTKEKPAIFMLHKMGPTAALVQLSSRTYRIAKNGIPMDVNLSTGKTGPTGQLRIQAWTEEQDADDRGHYRWTCRVSVPNGGLIRRVDKFGFEAPTGEYHPFDEIVMPREAQDWHPEVQRDYFLKLNDGCFARIGFKMIAQGDHFFRLESYLNPVPGSRNLEFDPAKQINK